MGNWTKEYYRQNLNTEQKYVYDALYTGWTSLKKEVKIFGHVIDQPSVSEVIDAIIKDHPELFWVNYYYYSVSRCTRFMIVELDFYFEEREVQGLLNDAYAWRERIVKQLPKNFTQREQIWVLYDYLARQVTYGKQTERYSQTIIGPISPHNHVSVCEGIAKSFKFLCDKAGIPCLVVFGKADFGPENKGEHAWNIVECESGKYHLDVTAALSYAQIRGQADKTNFLHRECQMDNYQWNRALVPAT